MRALFGLLVAGGLAIAQERPPQPGQVAAAVVRAWQAGETDALKALAARAQPDPWLVADELCQQGRHDAAAAFAKAAPRPDNAKLPAYVVGRRGAKPDPEARAALERFKRAFGARRFDECLAALKSIEADPKSILSVHVPFGTAIVFVMRGDNKSAAAAYIEAGRAALALGWLAEAERAFGGGVSNAIECGDVNLRIDAQTRIIEVELARGNAATAARYHMQLATVLKDESRLADALAHADRAAQLRKRLGLAADLIETHHRRGVLLTELGRVKEAQAVLERVLASCRERKDRKGEMRALVDLGHVYEARGDVAAARALYRHSVELAEAAGDRHALGTALGNLGIAESRLGALREGIRQLERALVLMRAEKDVVGELTTLGSIGSAHMMRASYAQALACADRAMRLAERSSPRHVPQILTTIGLIRSRLGELEQARRILGRSLQLVRKQGDRPLELKVLISLGTVAATHEEALEIYGRCLALARDLDDRAMTALVLGNIGSSHEALGQTEKALEHYEEALREKRAVGDLVGIPPLLYAVGDVHADKGDHETALHYYDRALALARELEIQNRVVETLRRMAESRLEQGDARAAMKHSREAIALLPRIVASLSDEQGAQARGAYVGLFDTAIAAAMRANDPEALLHFLESSRAGSLLESLGGRDEIMAVALPAELRKAELQARAAEMAASERLRRAMRSGVREEIRAARRALETARNARNDVIDRIQRTAKAAASVAYPEPVAADRLQALLADGDALVLYAVPEEGDAVALVVTRADMRIRRLGDAGKLAKLCASLTLNLPENAPGPEVDALRRSVVAPLALKGVRRVFVSPHGPLARVPFAMLFEPRDVVYVPSGTVMAWLRGVRAERGKRVLALGAPAYGGRAPALPSSGAEARAVGDVVLLEGNATKARLRKELSRGERWRAVHLACHAYVDEQYPSRSALALTPGANDDGKLSPLDLASLRLPADIVVLAACRTAAGKLYRGEGVVGFTRAFMMAGAPRVVVSLWKVDDAATRALMVKFYELWADRPAAAALREAQAYVAAQEKWRHPYYWAAWQLWGLAE